MTKYIITDLFAVGQEDMQLKVITDQDFNILEAISLQNFNGYKVGEQIPNNDDFDFEGVAEIFREDAERGYLEYTVI